MIGSDWIRTSDLLNPIYRSRPLPVAECHKCKPSGGLRIPLFTQFTQITAENQRFAHIFQAFPCPTLPASRLRKWSGKSIPAAKNPGVFLLRSIIPPHLKL